MWINVTRNGTGTLINEPVFVDYVHAGDEVHFESAEIVDVAAIKSVEEKFPAI